MDAGDVKGCGEGAGAGSRAGTPVQTRTGAPWGRLVELQGHRVLFRTDLREALDWLEYYHSPFFRVEPWEGGAPAPEAEVVALYGEWPQPRPPGRGRRLRLYLGQRGRLWPLGPGLDLIVEEGPDPIAYWMGEGRTVMLGRPGLRRHLQQPARIVREALVQMALARDGLKLHAGAAVLEGRTLLVLGPRGAGKTTLVLRLSAEGGFCANDRALLLASAGGALVQGLPLSVRVGEGTASALGGLSPLVGPGAARDGLRLEQPRQKAAAWRARGGVTPRTGGNSRRGQDPKVEITPQEVAAALQVSVCASAPLGAVVVLRRRPAGDGRTGPPGPVCAPVPRAWRARHLAAALLWPDPAFPPSLFRPPGPRRREPPLRTREAFRAALEVPWLAVEGAVEDERLAEAVLRAWRGLTGEGCLPGA